MQKIYTKTIGGYEMKKVIAAMVSVGLCLSFSGNAFAR